MASRRTPPSDPVTIEHDGAALTAERGEPLAAALVAAGRLLLARSPKLHRPRGPYCLAGACDGCLARVDGEPNVMTCLRPARGGEKIETQNVLGVRGVDLLRATDFLFPHGVDHHRLFAGVVGVSRMTQVFARRVAGLGTLPDDVLAARPTRRRDTDVLIVGGGASGLAAAAVLGPRATVVERSPQAGGALAARDPEGAERAAHRARERGATFCLGTVALGLYREPPGTGPLTALLVDDGGATLSAPRHVLLCPGQHAGPAEFENNDLPGVFSARAALTLFRRGIRLGARLAVVGADEDAELFAALAREDGASVERIAAADVISARGLSVVESLTVRDGAGERRVRVEAVICAGIPTPCLELAVQAGAQVSWQGTAYQAMRDPDGKIAAQAWLAGSAAGDANGAAGAERIARAIPV